MTTTLIPRTAEAPSQTAPEAESPLFGWVMPALGVLSVLASCVLWSLKRQMWGDEVFTSVEMGDPSLAHLFRALPHLGGGGMPLFYLAGWPWAHLFGSSDLSLRLFSSAGVCGAFLVLYYAMRRRLGARAAFLGVAFGLFACLVVMEQNSEARSYGLYLLLSAVAAVQVLRIAETPQPGAGSLAWLALTQGGLVLGHVLGLIYAAWMLAALVAADLWEGRFRGRVYGCFMAGWLALLPWIPAIRSSMAVGKPHGWIPMPTPGDLGIGFSYWLFEGLYWQIVPHSATAVLILGWLIAVLCVAVLIIAAVGRLRTESAATRPVELLGLALVAAPLAFYAVSHLVAPIFLPRYLIPSALGLAMLAVCWARHSRIGNRAAVAIVSCGLLLLPVASALLARPPALDVARVDNLAAGRPVVCDSLKDFLVMTRYSPRTAQLRYPMDRRAIQLEPGTDADYRLMANYGREGYWPGELLDASEILRSNSFLVLDNGAQSNWFRVEIEHNPRFTWRQLARIDSSRSLIEVERAESAH